MVLSGEVRDRRGRLLIPAGAEIQEKHLKALRLWGVLSVDVEGGPSSDAELQALEPWALESAEKQLARLFSVSGRDHPLLEALFDLCRRRLAGRIQEEAASHAR